MVIYFATKTSYKKKSKTRERVRRNMYDYEHY